MGKCLYLLRKTVQQIDLLSINKRRERLIEAMPFKGNEFKNNFFFFFERSFKTFKASLGYFEMQNDALLILIYDVKVYFKVKEYVWNSTCYNMHCTMSKAKKV